MRILFFGTYDARRHPRIRTLREGFSSLGAEVSECNAPLTLDTSARLRMLQRPWLVPILGARLLSCWWRLWQMSRRIPPVDAVVVGYMGHFDVHLGRLLWRHKPIALDHLISARDTALDRRADSRSLLWVLDKLDRAALRAADVPFVDTDEHLGLLPDRDRARAVVVRVGAPSDWFHPLAARSEPPLEVVFFGLYTPLQGTPIIGRAIGSLAGEPIRFTMIGSGQDLSTVKREAADNVNVTWLDWVDAGELPSLVARHQVCLGIFAETPKAMRVVPNKVFQGAAAGCAIVTSDTKPQRRALGQAAVFVAPADPEGLAEALRRLASHPDELLAFRRAARRRADEAFRPATVASPLGERLERLMLR